MEVAKTYQEMVKLRDYSSAFSRSAFQDVIKYNDYSHFDWLFNHYKCSIGKSISYYDYIKNIYSIISKEYKCEYVYKNELLKHLICEYGTQRTSAYNEFHVGNSIADIVLFNGESKAFEIKTEYDTPRRLEKQMYDYKKIFDRCYIVVPYEKVDAYMPFVDENTGVIALKRTNGHIILQSIREASYNETIDAEILITCLRTKEYESIVSSWLGELPNVPQHVMYKECLSILKEMPQSELKHYFIEKLKERQLNVREISKVPSFLRQMCLGMNLSQKNIELLISRLKEPIIKNF